MQGWRSNRQPDAAIFHFSKAQQHNLQPGVRLRCFGEIRRGGAGLEMVHPEYKQLQDDESTDDALTAIYPTTEGVHQLSLRKISDQALEYLASGRVLQDWLPQSLMERLRFS